MHTPLCRQALLDVFASLIYDPSSLKNLFLSLKTKKSSCLCRVSFLIANRHSSPLSSHIPPYTRTTPTPHSHVHLPHAPHSPLARYNICIACTQALAAVRSCPRSLAFWSRAGRRRGSFHRRGARTFSPHPLGTPKTQMKPVSPNQRMRVETSTATAVPEQRAIVVVGAFPWYVWPTGRGRRREWRENASKCHRISKPRIKPEVDGNRIFCQIRGGCRSLVPALDVQINA